LYIGLVGISALSIIPATKQKFMIARDAFVGPLKCKGILSSTLGGAILGMGMTICGTVSCEALLCQPH